MKNIKFSLTKTNKAKSIQHFFKKVFTKSEGKKEGNIVGILSFKLAKLIDGKNVIGIEGTINNRIVAYIFLTTLVFKEDYLVYLLAPVAVDNKIQKKGVSKKIIKFGIKYLKEHKVDILMTYGDPSYYSKVGFKKTKVSIIPAPYKLSQPIGWLINKISSKKINKFKSEPNCVRPFRNKKLW
jgi:predicted N-acetyltransferase YhbS